MKEIKIKRYNNIEEMNYNYNVLIYYKNKVNISSDIFKSLDSFASYVSLIMEMDPVLGHNEIRRNYWALRRLISKKFKDVYENEGEEYIIKALRYYVITEYIKIAS